MSSLPVAIDDEAITISIRPSASTGDAPAPATNDGTPGATRVLAPSSLRLDSRVLWLHTSFLWTTNCIFCTLLLHKLNNAWPSASWWLIFTPLFIGHALHMPLLCWVLCTVNQHMLQQLGPPPPRRASLAMHAQYTALRAVMVRSHVVDNISALLDSLAMLTVKLEFAHLLNIGQFQDTSLRVVFSPIWAVWVVTLMLVCTKHRRERVAGSQRDLTYIFLLMVAFKVDDDSGFPWQVVFIVPWIWLCGVLVLGLVVAVSLTCARGWRRLKELLMPIGFMLLLFATGVPQFAFCRNLVVRLEGNLDITYEAILIPAAVGWAAMWAASGILALGLRNRERMRASLLASGAVWTAHEALARGLQPGGMREEEQQRVDAMSEEEVVALARQYMTTRGVPLPTALMRVGPSLYKRMEPPGAAAPPTSEPIKPQQGHSGSVQMSVLLQQPGGEPHATQSTVPGADGQAASAAGPRLGPSRALGAMNITHSSGTAIQYPALAGAARHNSTTTMQPQQAPGYTRHSSGSDSQHQLQQQPSLDEGLLPGLLQPAAGIASLFGISDVQDHSHPMQRAGTPGVLEPRPGAEEADDGICVICFDAEASCVLLGCGHGGFCRRCAHLLLVRPPNVCPSCRQPIEQVVELVLTGAAQPALGKVCAVKDTSLLDPDASSA